MLSASVLSSATTPWAAVRRGLGLGVLFLLIHLGTSGGPASAIADEVHFDPNSPAGKEYALPLTQAREEALGEGTGGEAPGPGGSGGSGSAESGAGEPPLFGAGVGTAASKGGGAPGAGGATGRGENPTRSSDGSSPSGAPADIEAARIDEDSSYPLDSALLLIAAVLALGAFIALGLRGLARARPA